MLPNQIVAVGEINHGFLFFHCNFAKDKDRAFL